MATSGRSEQPNAAMPTCVHHGARRSHPAYGREHAEHTGYQGQHARSRTVASQCSAMAVNAATSVRASSFTNRANSAWSAPQAAPLTRTTRRGPSAAQRGWARSRGAPPAVGIPASDRRDAKPARGSSNTSQARRPTDTYSGAFSDRGTCRSAGNTVRSTCRRLAVRWARPDGSTRAAPSAPWSTATAGRACCCRHTHQPVIARNGTHGPLPEHGHLQEQRGGNRDNLGPHAQLAAHEKGISQSLHAQRLGLPCVGQDQHGGPVRFRVSTVSAAAGSGTHRADSCRRDCATHLEAFVLIGGPHGHAQGRRRHQRAHVHAGSDVVVVAPAAAQ